jgi:diacylglycerol kinase (CTP)
MRESEVDGYNGVIWYLAGTWAVLRFCPKDIGGVSVLLLSWCDPAASTVGRLYGQYTPQLRRGKSLAGSAAALLVGALTGWMFWGWLAPTFGPNDFYGEFAFNGSLRLPVVVTQVLGWDLSAGKITGMAAVGVLGVVSGIIASASEAIDLFGWDDNFTIPVICGVGLWGFLKVFG